MDKKKDHKRTLLLLLIVGLMGTAQHMFSAAVDITSASPGIIAWSLMLEAVVPLSADRAPRIGQLSPLSVVITIGFYSTTPIFFEAAVEASHPLPQGSVIMLMTFIFNGFFYRHSGRSRAKQVRSICIHLSAFETCISLFNWLLSGASFLILILLLLFYQNQDRRAQLDA